MSYFTQYKLKDGRKIRGKHDSKSSKVCISRADLEKLIYEADVAYEQAEQLQTIIENLAEIKRQAVTKVLNKLGEKIERYKSSIDTAISEDELKIEGAKGAYEDCLGIIDTYKTESLE